MIRITLLEVFNDPEHLQRQQDQMATRLLPVSMPMARRSPWRWETARGAAAYLNRIPDADLCLFAQIERDAALGGLPELQGIQREQRGRARDRA